MKPPFVTALNHYFCCLMATAGKGKVVFFILPTRKFNIASSATARLGDSSSGINITEKQAGCGALALDLPIGIHHKKPVTSEQPYSSLLLGILKPPV